RGVKELLQAAKERALAERAVKLARTEGAREAVATLEVSRRGHLRFAENGPTTSGEAERRVLTLEASIGRKHASSSTEDLSPEGLSRLAAQAVALARLAPEDPEYVSEPPPQKYTAIAAAYDPSVAAAEPRIRAEAVLPVLDAA